MSFFGDVFKILTIGGEKIRQHFVKKLVLGFEIVVKRAYVQPDLPHHGADAGAVEAVFKEHPAAHFQNLIFGATLDLLFPRHGQTSQKKDLTD